MTRLSAVIITKNEEANIERCLRSVSWAHEIILVDSESSDETVEIAWSLGARVFRPEWIFDFFLPIFGILFTFFKYYFRCPS